MASQPKKKQSFRFWLPWNPTSASRPSAKASSSKPAKAPPKAPSKSSAEVEQKPPPQRASQSKSNSPSPSPLRSPLSSPSQRRAAGQVPQRQEQQQPPSPGRLSPVSSPSPPRPKEEDPTPAAAVSPTPSEAAPQPEPPALTQEVSQSPLFLLTEKPDKTVESESPTHQQEILSHASQPTQDLKPDANSVEPRSQSTQDSEHKAKTQTPTNGTISEETPSIEHETESMQEKTQVNLETIDSTHPSQFPQITKPSELKQADQESEKIAEERPKVNEETITENEKLEVTKDRNPISPESKIVDEANKDERPNVEPEPHQPAKPSLISIEEPKDIEERNKFSAEPDSQSNRVLSEKAITDSREEEDKKALREQERTTLIPVIPHAPIRGDSHQKENGETSNLVQKINIRHSEHIGSEQGLSVITLAGENNGASMHIRRETPNETGFRRYKIDEHPSAEINNGKNKALTDKSSQIDEALPLTISINSNVQAINNSVLHESSCSEDDPGVHLTYSGKPTKTVDSKSEIRSIQSLKSASNTTSSQTLIHQRNIKG